MLIDNFKEAHKMWSVVISSIGALIMTVFTVWPDTAFIVWQSMPDEVRAAFPQSFVSGIGAFLFIMTAIARIVKQNKLSENQDNGKL